MVADRVAGQPPVSHQRQPLGAVDIVAGGVEDGLHVTLGEPLQDRRVPRGGLRRVMRVETIVKAQRQALGACRSGRQPASEGQPCREAQQRNPPSL